MKRRKHLFNIANFGNKNKEKNKNEKKAKDLSIYGYKCGQKNIKLTVQRLEVPKTSEAAKLFFYYNCIFCNKDFDSQTQICPDCNRPLVKINLKKCPQFGAKNNPLKQTCWVCNLPFPALELPTEKETQLLLTLNVDGIAYRNTDKQLGLGIRKLFEDLMATGFSKEPLEAWVKIHEDDIEFKRDLLKQECRQLARQSRRKSLLYILMAILLVVISLLINRVFWAN